MVKKLVVPLMLVILLVSLTLLPILGNSGGGTWSLFQATSVYAQASRILIEGADSVLSQDLLKSDQLSNQVASVSPRILIEYADSILSIDLTPPLLVSNQPPTANAGTDQTISPGAMVTFDASASYDPDGSVVSYEWDFGDGAGGTGRTATHTYSAEGVHTVTLTVTDNNGAKATDTLTVQVIQENRPPVISSLRADEQQVMPGTSVGLTASTNDPDGDTLIYSWTCDDGSITGTGSSVTWTAPNRNGTYQVSLEISDGYGGIQKDSISIRVSSETIVTPSSPQQPYVDLYGHKTDVIVGDEIILYLSAVNPITSPGTLIVQLTLRIPSGWSITSSGFGHGAGGLRTNTYEIEQGPSQRVIDVNILANEPFEGVVEGKIDYYFAEYEEKKYHSEVNLPVTASLVGASPESAAQPSTTSETSSENNGISGTLIAVIIGVCAATVGGVLTRVIWRRTTRQVTPKSGVSDNLPLPRADERPKPHKEVKKDDSLAPDRVPEEKDLVIKEGQKGISYERLFFPYVKGATSIMIYDPYIRAPHQISNLSEFCEILDVQGTALKVKLVTSQDDFPESQQENKLNELKKVLANDNIEFEYVFDNTLHDRRIETDTGWRIKLGRGLDIFQRRDDESTLGFSDQTKRKCKQTIIDYRRFKTAD